MAFPVRARNAHQLERRDALGRRNMRPTAEIDELAGGVKRNHRLNCFFFHQLALENLIRFRVQLDSLRLGHQLAFVLQILRRKLVHFLFNFREIVGSKRFVAQEFVEESSIDRRSDTQLHIRI